MSDIKALVERLEDAAEHVDTEDTEHRQLLLEAARALASLSEDAGRLRAEIKSLKDDIRNAASEATWKERQGDEYGSY